MKQFVRWFFRDFVPHDKDADWVCAILCVMPFYAAAFIIEGVRYLMR